MNHQPGKNRYQMAYATMIKSVDRSLGKIMKTLRQIGIEQNTVLIFMSDNGGLVAHSGPPTTNYPLSSGKGSSTEGGYREPMIIRWPGTVNEGAICTTPVIAEDLFPTILSIAGADIPDSLSPGLDGVDLTPYVAAERRCTSSTSADLALSPLLGQQTDQGSGFDGHAFQCHS